jgi:Flp pilus assembly pilin Flp
MSLKKYLKSSGQAIVEYFILLVLIAALTIIGGSILFGKVQISTDRFRNSAFNAMVPYPGP